MALPRLSCLRGGGTLSVAPLAGPTIRGTEAVEVNADEEEEEEDEDEEDEEECVIFDTVFACNRGLGGEEDNGDDDDAPPPPAPPPTACAKLAASDEDK